MWQPRKHRRKAGATKRPTIKMADKLKASSAAEWRERTKRIESNRRFKQLSCGAVVELRQPQSITHLLHGRHKLEYVDIARRALLGDLSEADTEIIQDENKAEEFMQYVESVVVSHVLDPRVVQGEPGEGEVSLDELGDLDKYEIFADALNIGNSSLTGGLTGSVDTFRQKPNLPAGSVNGAHLRKTGKRARQATARRTGTGHGGGALPADAGIESGEESPKANVN
jgi:hypothetical protein